VIQRIKFNERPSRRHCLIATIIGACFLGGCGEDSPQKLLMKGMQAAVQGDEAAALASLDQAVALAPDDPSLFFVRGGLHDSLGDPAAAIADYERAIMLAPHLEPGISMQLEYLREQVSASRTGYSTPSTFVPAAVEDAGPTIDHVRFCASRPRGYRDYVPQPGARYRGGDTAWIYFDVGNLESRRRFDGGLENGIRQSLKLKDAGGNLLADFVIVDEVVVIDTGIDGDRVFLRNHIDIPADTAAGDYSVELVVEDKFAGAITQADCSFTVSD
jgi:tetratricopeptide (TPR) repeat protein